jgi:AcrR family transcriptional regulator
MCVDKWLKTGKIVLKDRPVCLLDEELNYMTLKEAIVIESLKLFSLKGYCGTSINDIMEASGVSKGGFYNHYSSKEELFYEVLKKAQRFWRQRTLEGLREIDDPVVRLITFLENYRDRYLKDVESFPGGCIFITFAVELGDQIPYLADVVSQGFDGVKAMIGRFIEEGRESGELKGDVDANATAEMLFSGMLGASIRFNLDKSTDNLDKSVGSLIDSVNQLRP